MSALAPPRALEDLKPDCARCAGLCCVLPGFEAGDDFAHDKPALIPCKHLDGRNLCKIHDTLDREGYLGCARYDCLGAGQRIARQVHKGANWRKDQGARAAMAESFRRLRHFHTVLELLLLAEALPLSPSLEARRGAMIEELAPTPGWTEESLAAAEADGLEGRARALLADFRAAAQGLRKG